MKHFFKKIRACQTAFLNALLLAFLAVLLPAAANAQVNLDIGSLLNQARTSECKTTGLSAFQESKPLTEVAHQRWLGSDITRAAKTAAYAGRQFSDIVLSGNFDALAIRRVLTQNYCATLTSPNLTQAAFYMAEQKLVIVLAAPYQIDIDNQTFAQEVLNLTNTARSQARSCGDDPFKAAPPLVLNSTLNKVASNYAIHQAQNNYMGHTGRDGSQPAERVTRGGYVWQAVGENVAAGQTTPAEVVAAWVKSPHHCANLMNATFTEMGIGYSVNMNADLKIYWTQLFGRPRKP